MTNPFKALGFDESTSLRKKYEAPTDNGFFGPGSATGKEWSYPTSAFMGFQRAVTIEQLDPNLNAAVEDSGGVRYRPRTRYERTMTYFALAAFGDTATTAQAADVPRSRDEVRAFYAGWRPRIAASELAQSMTDFILHTEVSFPEELPIWMKPLKIPFAG